MRSIRVVEAFLGKLDNIVIPVAVQAPQRSACSSEGLKAKANVEPVCLKPKSPGLQPNFRSPVRERVSAVRELSRKTARMREQASSVPMLSSGVVPVAVRQSASSQSPKLPRIHR